MNFLVFVSTLFWVSLINFDETDLLKPCIYIIAHLDFFVNPEFKGSTAAEGKKAVDPIILRTDMLGALWRNIGGRQIRRGSLV